jgi:hypothetical protein
MRLVLSVAACALAACKSSSREAPPAGGSAPVVADGPAAADPRLAELTAIASDPARIAARAGSAPGQLAWDLFVYLGWQAVPGERGVPDPGGAPGVSPTVWQTWKEVHEIYLAGGAAPLAWDDGGPSGPPTLSLTEIDGTTLIDVNGNPITYTVLMNQGAFDYLVSRALYGWNGQAALRSVGAAPVAFPASAMEVKASWKILDPIADKDRLDHYITQPAYLPQDGGGAPTKVAVGLTGLHIISRATPSWVWMTFEQLENPATTGVTLLLPIDPAVAAVNARMQQALAGTPLAYYQLNGVQTEFSQLLANTQIETRFQRSSSCMSCHARASVSTGPRPRLDVFVMQAGNLVGPTGDPPTAPFGPAPDQFSALDYVWSMREAQR